MNTNPVTTSSAPQGNHMLGNEWNGIGAAGHIALFVILAVLLLSLAVALAKR